MEGKIYEFIKEKGPGVSWVELQNNIEGFKTEEKEGGYSYFMADRNVVLWEGLSKKAYDAMEYLRKNELILISTSHLLVYLFDGGMLNMPIATDDLWDEKEGKYTKEVWVPVEFRINKKKEFLK